VNEQIIQPYINASVILYTFIVHVVNPKLWSLYEVIYGSSGASLLFEVGLANFFLGFPLLGWCYGFDGGLAQRFSWNYYLLPFHCLAFDCACVTADWRVEVRSFSDNLLSLIPITILFLASSS